MEFNWYERIKSWYPRYWNAQMVQNAVKMGKITQEQADSILNGNT